MGHKCFSGRFRWSEFLTVLRVQNGDEEFHTGDCLRCQKIFNNYANRLEWKGLITGFVFMGYYHGKLTHKGKEFLRLANSSTFNAVMAYNTCSNGLPFSVVFELAKEFHENRKRVRVWNMPELAKD